MPARINGSSAFENFRTLLQKLGVFIPKIKAAPGLKVQTLYPARKYTAFSPGGIQSPVY